MKRICVVTAVPATVRAFLKEHILVLSKNYEITIVTNITADENLDLPEYINVRSIAIKRDINLLADLKSMFALWKLFRENHFDLVLSVTPKAGLLSSLAGYFSRVPVRLHWFTGQVWATKTGFRRSFLKSVDKLLAACITDALVDSVSQFDFLIKENVLKHDKGEVLGKGSICGVNLVRFKFDQHAYYQYRDKLGLTSEHNVLLFLGRLNKDKGILDLVAAFNLIDNAEKKVHLVLVGPDEQNIQQTLIAGNQVNDNIHFVGGTSSPEKWLSIADVFCLPSYREGFGSSVIEAAAVGVPAVASKIYGLTDAIVDNHTGLMHEAANISQIKCALDNILSDDSLRKELGKNARQRVEDYFNQTHISNLLLQYLNQKLEKTKIKL